MGAGDSGEPQHGNQRIRFVIQYPLAAPNLFIKGQQAGAIDFAAQNAFAHELQVVVMLTGTLRQI